MEFGLYPEGYGKSKGFKQEMVGANSCSGYRIRPLIFNLGIYRSFADVPPQDLLTLQQSLPFAVKHCLSAGA